MDCASGALLRQQMEKGAAMMHGGGNPLERAQIEQDSLLHDPLSMPVPSSAAAATGNQWAQHFSPSPQAAHEQMMAVMQQQELEMAFAHQQHQQYQGQTAQMHHHHQQQRQRLAGAAVHMQQQQQMNQMMTGMAIGAMGAGMMIPRTGYQPGITATPMMSSTTATAPATTTTTTTTATAAVPQLPAVEDTGLSAQLAGATWCQDYDGVTSIPLEGQALQTTAEKEATSEFYSLMDRIRRKELMVDEDAGALVDGPGPDPDLPEDTEYLQEWATAEGLQIPVHSGAGLGEHTPSGDAYQLGDGGLGSDMQLQDDLEDWAREYATMSDQMQRIGTNTDYPFEPNNPYMYHDHPLEEGKEMLQLGNLAEAALAFEAVCQKEPELEEAWRLLGTTQAENEKDNLAIIALNKARSLNPKDLKVHAALAVSHTNERNVHLALESLRAWLLAHPKYEELGNVDVSGAIDEASYSEEGIFVPDPAAFAACRMLFNAAEEMDSSDADLHTLVGVLYSVSHDYDRASDSFRKAVALQPTSAERWNKLGATLANGSHPEQALEAYNKALDINPGYVRAMYNMAVAHSNMGSYALAAKELVRVIAVQHGGTNATGEASVEATRGVWDFLRMTLNLMDRRDLVELTWANDVKPFLKEFNMEDLY